MTEQPQNTIEAIQRALEAMHEQSQHAYKALISTQQELNQAGISGPALCTASAASYVSLVTAVCFAGGVPKEEVLGHCKAALDTLSSQVDEIYSRLEAEVKGE